MLYRFTLRAAGPLGTPLRSDTLFGHACWTVSAAWGEDELRRFLESAREQKPPVVFSDAFPAGCIPRPLVELPTRAAGTLAEYQRTKQYRKLRWISRHGAASRNWAIGEESLENVAPNPGKRVVMRNVVGRATGTTGDNALYATEEIVLDGGWECVDIYVHANDDWREERVTEIVTAMFAVGYGRDQTVGMGAMEIVSSPERVSVGVDGGDVFMSLSRCVPGPAIDLAESRYALEAKYGKVWSGLGEKNPFKKPIMQCVPGSLFRANDRRERYGRVLTDVHDNTAVVENCMTIPLFLPEEVLRGND